MDYSLKSLDESKFLSCFAALNAYYSRAVLMIGSRLDKFEGEKATEVLKKPISLPVTIEVTGKIGTIEISFSKCWRLLEVWVDGASDDEKDHIHELIRGTMGLRETTQEERESDASPEALNRRIVRIQNLLQDLSTKALSSQSSEKQFRCFLSFRFDEHSKSLALDVKAFLELVDVVSGLGYEPRSVSEKVLDRLSGQIDLFIVIFAKGGESTWLHQEIGVAKGRNIPVLVMKEEGTSFSEGLLSDLEYASFPVGVISEAFISLLQALRYLRIQKAK